jgi:hypothetical protein
MAGDLIEIDDDDEEEIDIFADDRKEGAQFKEKLNAFAMRCTGRPCSYSRCELKKGWAAIAAIPRFAVLDNGVQESPVRYQKTVYCVPIVLLLLPIVSLLMMWLQYWFPHCGVAVYRTTSRM